MVVMEDSEHNKRRAAYWLSQGGVDPYLAGRSQPFRQSRFRARTLSHLLDRDHRSVGERWLRCTKSPNPLMKTEAGHEAVDVGITVIVPIGIVL
jgi:hypothetical protein